MPTVIIDANVMLGALMGRSLPLIAALAQRTPVLAPLAQLAETRKILGKLEQANIDQKLDALLEIVSPLENDAFEHLEDEARERLGPGGQSDWPVLAAALALDADIWSRDIDLFGSGVAVWSTRNIRYLMDSLKPPEAIFNA